MCYDIYCKNNSGEHMKKITVTIQNNTILFKYRTNKPVEENLMNTNVFNNNELVFSDQYLQENSRIVSLFLNDIVIEKNITELVFSNNTIADMMLDLLKLVQEIESVTIMDNSILSYSICEKIINNKNIKKINCYSLPQFMIEELDRNGILVESRSEVLFTSNFMADNNLTSFSKIFYKTSIKIDNKLTESERDDIHSFFQINKYIKVIHIDNYSLDLLKDVVDILIACKEKNILIQLHEDIDNADDVEALRKLNKKIKRRNIKITLVYSEGYLESNYLQHIIFTTLKFCSVIIFTIVASVFGYVVYNNYESEVKVNAIKDKLNALMAVDDPAMGTGNNGVVLDDDQVTLNSYKILEEVNPDMVGWLTVKGTKIDYPVVRGSDNDKYLTTNFYKEADYNGWVFMDYRNNPLDLDDNTIIYAHNRFSSGIMFGTLPNIRKKSWLEKEENYYITFNTMEKVQKWRIFSYYTIDVTSDYLTTNFESEKDHKAFINKITKRSRKNFKVTVTPEDKILTLSTCYNTEDRFVVHAVLVNDDEISTDSENAS